MTSVLTASSLSKRFRDGSRQVDAVRDVSLEIPEGCLWVLSGPSGSGKSTLLSLLGGILTPTSGEVRLDDAPFSRLREHHRTERRRRRIGLVFQGLGLIDGLSVLENVLVPTVPLGGSTPEHEARAEALLERFDLRAQLSARITTLSGGERQRVAIARALVLSPRILLLDEPTAHLDTARAQEITSLLAELAADGHSVLAATHDPRLASDPRVSRKLELVDGALGELSC